MGNKANYVIITSADGGKTALEYITGGGYWSANYAQADWCDLDTAQRRLKALKAPKTCNGSFISMVRMKPGGGIVQDKIPPETQFRGVTGQLARRQIASSIANFLRESS